MSLACLTLSLLCARPAHAQGGPPPGWDITYSQSGSDTFTGAPTDVAAGSPYAWGTSSDQYLTGGFAVSASSGHSSTITGYGTITATLTWDDHGTGIAPPPNIYLAVTSSASYGGNPGIGTTLTGNANDGLNDPVSLGVSQGTHNEGPFPSSSGTVTYSLPLSCSCSVSVPAGSSTTFIKVGHSMTVAVNNLAVTISSSVDPTSYKKADPNTPKDANGDPNYIPTPHVQASDGTMSGDVGLAIDGPNVFTNIKYHANLLGTWQTAGSSYNWFSSLKQQGDSGSLYPPDFTNSYLDPWWVASQTPGIPPHIWPGDADPKKNPDHINIKCTDGGGAVATGNYYMTLHPAQEQNYPDHMKRGIENLRKAPNAAYVRSTQADSTLTVYAEKSDSWGISATTDGPIGDFIAGILGVNLSVSYTYSYNAGVQTSLQHVNAGFATYLEEFDAYKYHQGKVDSWNMGGYAGTAPYHVKEPDSPSGGYQAHSPPIYLGSGGTP